jgi:hypothetical protein
MALLATGRATALPRVITFSATSGSPFAATCTKTFPVSPEALYRSTLASKAALIVIDDIWGKADLHPFLGESPASAFCSPLAPPQ